MPPLLQRRSSLAVATAVIFVAGAAAGLWRYGEARDAALATLTLKAQRSAVALDDATLQQLHGTRGDLGSPAFALVQKRLAELDHLEAGLRFVRLLRRLPDTGQIILLADSHTENSGEPSASGREQPFAASPALQSTAITGIPAAEGPRDDQFGRSVVSYAVIGEPSSDAPVHLLALGFAADQWHRALWGAAFGTAAYVWMFLILPLVALVSTRRQAQQRDALRNLTEAMEQGHSAVVIVDLGQRIEYANTGFCRLL
ncbi:MAG TPA: hypothetical protein VEA63_17310, partial [Opitutus sp.]|nr:hypothetical protein [Opitutus sp.]